MRVGVVGLGTMGLPLARHLLAAGHDVVGCDLEPGSIAPGITILPVASITRSASTSSDLPSSAIFSPSTRTSPT